MKTGMTMAKDGVEALVESLKALPARDVLVGIPEDKAERREGTISNAALGYIHEHGAPEANIPARPFLVQGIINAEKRIAALFKQAADYAMKGDKAGQDRALNAAGLVAQSSAKNAMSTSEFPPLAESTLAARRRRGRTGVRPLIDTGQLRNSINYVVRDQGGDK